MNANTNTVHRKRSSLVPDAKGIVGLRLVQAASDQSLVGTRIMLSAHEPVVPSASQVDACKSLLHATRPGTITVMSFHPGLAACEAELAVLAADRTVIGLAGIDSDRQNVTLVATSGSLTRQAKISLSSEDEELRVKRGCGLDIYMPGDEYPEGVRWAVLNCHDYTHVDLLRVVQDNQIEVLIVVTYNSATRLFWQYAISDVHRLFCYVVIANVAELGGSGVFAPFRRVGREKNAQLGAGGQIFGARGAGEFQVNIDLDVGEIRSIRKEFAEHGFGASLIQRSRGSIYTAMAVRALHEHARSKSGTTGVRPRARRAHRLEF
jgi:hypothetical protein